MINIEVNGRIISADKGQTILEALRFNGMMVPTLCNVPELTPTGACRICVVEVEGIENLVPACSFPVEDNMKIKTHSGRVLRARKMNVELLLSSHPDDCLYCERNGNCELQKLAEDLNVRTRNISGKRYRYKIDNSSHSIIKDPSKCILCGRCVRICEEVTGVSALDFERRGDKLQVSTAMREPIDFSSCIECGMCLLSCPTGALADKTGFQELDRSFDDPEKTVVVQYTPEVSVSLAEEFGVKPGTDMQGIINSVLRRIGFNFVFESSSAAEMVVMEECHEFIQRLRDHNKLPMITSRCAAWVNYVEKFMPELLSYLAPVRSPHQVLGKLIKKWLSGERQMPLNRIHSVLITNCTAAKYEAARNEYSRENVPDIDFVLTTRELARLIRMHGINIESLEPEPPDDPFRTDGSAGNLFAVAGGELEAIIRTAIPLISKKELKDIRLMKLRKGSGIREEKFQVPGGEIYAASVSGMQHAIELAGLIADNKCKYNIIEIMACADGCVNGGGQPIPSSPPSVRSRIKTIYESDKNSTCRSAHESASLSKIYKTYNSFPGSPENKNQFFTDFKGRKVLR